MMFGVREICDVVLRAKSKMTLGNRTFYKNEPVIYFDTLKTSTLEGAATTVYATGGRGNARLIAWEGERTVTFTFEDALISPEGFAILSGAGLIDATEDKPIYVHTTSQVEIGEDLKIKVPEIACWTTGQHAHDAADIFCMVLTDGEMEVEPCVPAEVTYGKVTNAAGEEVDGTIITCAADGDAAHELKKGDVVLVDYYVKKTGNAKQIEITADKFAGNYYLEASTLFRREADGVDMPAEFIIPNGKIQSNFSFAMASSGDPSTFTFTMDAFPDYTKFDRTKKVIAALQVITDTTGEDTAKRTACTAPVAGE